MTGETQSDMPHHLMQHVGQNSHSNAPYQQSHFPQMTQEIVSHFDMTITKNFLDREI